MAELKEQQLITTGNFASARGQHLTLADEVKKLLAIDKTQINPSKEKPDLDGNTKT